MFLMHLDSKILELSPLEFNFKGDTSNVIAFSPNPNFALRAKKSIKLGIIQGK